MTKAVQQTVARINAMEAVHVRHTHLSYAARVCNQFQLRASDANVVVILDDQEARAGAT